MRRLRTSFLGLAAATMLGVLASASPASAAWHRGGYGGWHGGGWHGGGWYHVWVPPVVVAPPRYYYPPPVYYYPPPVAYAPPPAYYGP